MGGGSALSKLAAMIVGFDVGGTNARGVLLDPESGTIIDRDRTSSDGQGPELVAKLVQIVETLAQRNDTQPEAVGLGVAGLAHRSGTVHYSPNLPDLVEFPIGPALEEAVGVPVKVLNDATAGTWAEARFGAGRGADNLAYVALGTGIGTGFVVDGHLATGAHGFAGESGHMVVDYDGPEHITGQRGPWEYYASGSALGRLGREAAESGNFDAGADLAGDIAGITGFHVAEALGTGDPQAAVIFDGFCAEVARGIANLVMVLDPQRVIIGGGLTDIGEPLRAGIDTWLGKLTLGQAYRPRVEIVLAELGSDSGAIGAALMTVSSPRYSPS